MPDQPASETSLSRRETILVVEDENHIRTWIVGILKQQGYKVLAASDGQEGLQISTDYSNTIDLMICDFRMPKMTGGELIKRVTPMRAAMKVICLSAAGAESVSGFRAVTLLAKPFTLNGFLSTVKDVLGKPEDPKPTA